MPLIGHDDKRLKSTEMYSASFSKSPQITIPDRNEHREMRIQNVVIIREPEHLDLKIHCKNSEIYLRFRVL